MLYFDVVNTISSISSHLDVLRLELSNLDYLGNKFYKLKYNLEAARKNRRHRLLTFGGAFSNHIAAVAQVGKKYGFDTIGVIRGEELEHKDLNPTLAAAKANDMHLHFVDRDTFRNKESAIFHSQLKELFGDFYLIPEGGTNVLAVKGCTEILGAHTQSYDLICVAVGTGGTMAGILESTLSHQTVLGFSSLKGTFQENELKKYTAKQNYSLTDSYCFGGYGKIDAQLIRFMNSFKRDTNILLDPIYTGKMFFGISRMIQNEIIPANTRILAIHTGGTQGILGMNEILKSKNLPQIEL